MIYTFDAFELDTGTAELRSNGAAIRIEPQVFALLHHVLENPNRLVTRDELIKVIWNDRFVSNAAVDSRISQTRSALGDDAKTQKFIKTVRGRGIRFVAEVHVAGQKEALPDSDGASGAATARASIVVLPFDDMSPDQDQEFLADGLVEDITTALSRTGWLFVVSRNSAFTFKGQRIDMKQIGRTLGARYALEGSVRQIGSRLRITAQLIDTESGGHVWAEKFDGAAQDIFDLQDRITESVVGAIEPGLRRAETERAMAKPTESLDAYELYLRGVHQMYASTKASLDLAVEYLRRAIEIDPGYQTVKAYLALSQAIKDTQGWAADGEADEAIAMAREAIIASDGEPTVLRTAGYALGYFANKGTLGTGEDLGFARATLERVLEMCPNSAQTLNSLGFVSLWAGDVDRAITCFERALTISPRDQEVGYVLVGLATSHLILGAPETALSHARRAIAEMPGNGSAHRALVVALVRLNRLQEAQAATRQLLTLFPGATLASVKPSSNPPGYAEGFLADLRRSGYPED